jgi:hypothetical protein
VYDWTGVATTRDPNLLHPASSLVDDGWAAKLWDSTRSWDTQTLHALKTRLFAHPSSPFDAFASPILFFRTAGLSIPSTWLGSSTSTSDRDSLSNNTGNNEGKAGKDKEEEIEISRKSNLKFPPKDSGLRIPRSLFLTSKAEDSDRELARQAEEMVKVMRRSVVLHEFKERVLWDEDADAHQASEDRVQVCEISGGKEEGTVVRNWLDF